MSLIQNKPHEAFICILGNDGTGKSTMCNLINQNTSFTCVERSMKSQDPHVKKLILELKKIDKLTYSYSFEDDWYDFQPSQKILIQGKDIQVYWILLSAPVTTLLQRISKRNEMTIYEHQKCIHYFNKVYEEMAFFYGMEFANSDQSPQDVLKTILAKAKPQNIKLPIKTLTLEKLTNFNIETKIIEILSDQLAQKIMQQKILPDLQHQKMTQFYFPQLNQFNKNEINKILAARWIKNNVEKKIINGNFVYQFITSNQQQNLQIITSSGYLFENITQGQSKILFKIVSLEPSLTQNFKNKVIILLKSTVYSHKKQATSEISELGKIRAKGSLIFLEMLKRNHINHSYICVNRQGIILSRFVEINSLQIVFKKQFLGTDKYSYYGLSNKKEICNQSGQYQGGIYIRFDWRNPNHILNNSQSIVINENPYYYPIEKIVGKEKFFKVFLKEQKCKPIGDKCISEDAVNNYTNTNKIKQKAIQSYCTFQYYANQVGLDKLDGCMMIDTTCEYIWSQINPDCLRVKSIKQRQDYDKDIWRSGGSSSKEQITKKWSLFNEIFIEYFKNHRFMDVQLKNQYLCKQIYAQRLLSTTKIRPNYSQFYNKMIRGTRQRQVIGTIDIINGQPILVQSSQFKQKHSNGHINNALQYLSIIPQVLIVDIDAAQSKQKNNLKLISEISRNNHTNLYAVGGGIRTFPIANKFLSQYQHIVISSNLDIISQIPKQQVKRVIVQLSINDQNQVLTHGRTINTKINVIDKMKQLSQLGIKIISMTFNSSEGRLQGLPREQLRDIMYQIPGPIEKVIIAGGISSIEDIEYLWGFEKCVPQLGSAIWKRKVLIGDIYRKMIRFNEHGLVPAVIQDIHKKNLGLIYLNQQAVYKTCEQRYLYRYSRQHQKIMKKGQQSGNTQKIISINIDCDNDSLLITVDNQNPIFCHQNTQSCFFQQINKSRKMDLIGIQQHILKTKNGGGTGYTHLMQNNPKLALGKLQQEIQQFSYAENQSRKIQQCTDTFAHLLMYMNSQNISTSDVISILNNRSQRIRQPPRQRTEENIVRIGLGTGKHNKMIFDFVEKHLGVRILPHPQGKQRNYSIRYQILDLSKLQQNLKIKGNENLIFVSIKPKDMVRIMIKKFVKFGVNYSNVIQNSIDKYTTLSEQSAPGLKVALIKRKQENIDPSSWSETNKGMIISQYPYDVVNYFNSKNIPSNHYSLIRVSGHSQGFLSDNSLHYCDAIVQSGKTIKDNDLQIEAILKQEIKVMLFTLT